MAMRIQHITGTLLQVMDKGKLSRDLMRKPAWHLSKIEKRKAQRRTVMLRITAVAESPMLVTLKLDGRLVSDWVALLEEECLMWLRDHRTVLLDVAEVTFIDRRGVKMLRRITSDRLRIINASAFITDLIEGDEPKVS
jgi:anti-anti-sigma regulatory factor